MQIHEWGKRKRCLEEVPSHIPRKKIEQHKKLPSTELSEPQAEERNFRDSGGKFHTNWSQEDSYARVYAYGAGKDWQIQEHEAATALMLLAQNEAPLLGRAAITA